MNKNLMIILIIIIIIKIYIKIIQIILLEYCNDNTMIIQGEWEKKPQ